MSAAKAGPKVSSNGTDSLCVVKVLYRVARLATKLKENTRAFFRFHRPNEYFLQMFVAAFIIA